jgi:hypothetical protein
MLKYFARVLRALIVTCLGLGGGVGLMVFIIMLLTNGDHRSFQVSFSFGLCVGLMVAVIIGMVFLLIDLTARLFLAKGLYEDIWKLEQVREVPLEGTAKEVVAACRQALLAVPYVKAVSDDTEHLITRATIGQSLRSGGEAMEVEINPVGERSWRLRCVSRPLASGVVFDYGKNFENVEVWKREVSVLMAAGKHTSGRVQ